MTPRVKLSPAQKSALIIIYSSLGHVPPSHEDGHGIKLTTLRSLVRRGILHCKCEFHGIYEVTPLGEAALGFDNHKPATFHEALLQALDVLIPGVFPPDCVLRAEALHDICVDENEGYGTFDWLSADYQLGALDLEKTGLVGLAESGELCTLIYCVSRRLWDLGWGNVVAFYPHRVVFVDETLTKEDST